MTLPIRKPARRPVLLSIRRAVKQVIWSFPLPTEPSNPTTPSNPNTPAVRSYLYERGISLSGMEYSQSVLPGTEGTNFFAPKEADFKYFASKGLTIIRLPFLWERLQPTVNGPLDTTFKAYLDQAIVWAKQYGMKILLDVHNYGGRMIDGTIYKIGTEKLPISAFADFWGKVAAAYASEEGIFGFDLMNEPIDMPVLASAGTYNPNASGSIQLITNPSFEGGTDGWAVDGTFSRTSEDAYIGTYSIKQVSPSGNYDNFTTLNDATGIDVEPSTTYMLSFYAKISVKSGNAPYVQINKGGAFGTNVVAQTLTASSSWTRRSIQFTTDADTKKVWIRLSNNGGEVTAYYDGFNLTPGGTLQDYRTGASTGEVCTTTLMHQAAIDAIREVDTKHWIIMETDRYSGITQFPTNFGSDPDVWWHDPVGKTMLSFHYYLDPDHSGSYSQEWTQQCRDRMESEVRLMLDWAKKKGVKVFIGEYGVPVDDSASSVNYRQDLEAFMGLMDEYNCYGTYWAAGVNYSSPPNANPTNNYTTDASTMAVITAHVSKLMPEQEDLPAQSAPVTKPGTPTTDDKDEVPSDDTTTDTPANAVTSDGKYVTSNGSYVVSDGSTTQPAVEDEQPAQEESPVTEEPATEPAADDTSAAPANAVTSNGAYVTSDDKYVVSN